MEELIKAMSRIHEIAAAKVASDPEHYIANGYAWLNKYEGDE